MFGFLTDSIDNALSVVTKPFTGDLPSQREVAQLISDGMTVAAVSASFGVAEEVIRELLEDS